MPAFFDHPNPAGLSSRVRGSVEMKWWIREAVKIDEYIYVCMTIIND